MNGYYKGDFDAASRAIGRVMASGSHYFDRDTMRCFGSKTYGATDLSDGTTLLVMSNRDHGGLVVDGRRHYYIIRIDAAGVILRLPEAWAYSVMNDTYWLSLRSATAAMYRLADEIQTSLVAANPDSKGQASAE